VGDPIASDAERVAAESGVSRLDGLLLLRDSRPVDLRQAPRERVREAALALATCRRPGSRAGARAPSRSSCSPSTWRARNYCAFTSGVLTRNSLSHEHVCSCGTPTDMTTGRSASSSTRIAPRAVRQVRRAVPDGRELVDRGGGWATSSTDSDTYSTTAASSGYVAHRSSWRDERIALARLASRDLPLSAARTMQPDASADEVTKKTTKPK